jgi:DICT domain-containing protein/signal transduction histidine kinase
MLSTSLLQTLQNEHFPFRSQIYFKSTLTALSHALEDVVLSRDKDAPLVIANFQQERFYRQEIHRYRRIGQLTEHTYVLAAPERESGFSVLSDRYEAVPLPACDDLVHEWHLIIFSADYAACLICREQDSQDSDGGLESARRFEGFWSFDRQICRRATQWLLQRVVDYRPELQLKVSQALSAYGLALSGVVIPEVAPELTHTNVFGQRLMTYLQASQYKLLKAYRVLDQKSQQEQLINKITTVIRRSLDPEVILSTAVTELGQVFEQCRCFLYRCHADDDQVTILHEQVPEGMRSLINQPWSLSDNPLTQVALSQTRATVISHVTEAPIVHSHKPLQTLITSLNICSWLLMPIQYQGTVLGMIELHHSGPDSHPWREGEVALVEALATQISIALSQADLFTASAALNQKLQALERTQTNLINIVGHELRTPLSTIQICLESLESEPNIAVDTRQIMMDTALGDAARMRKLIGDFLLLSRLESQQMTLSPGLINIQEALSLAMSGLNVGRSEPLPDLRLALATDLPQINADGEGLVEVLARLLENACKFTPAQGQVTVGAKVSPPNPFQPKAQLVVSIADTGRGIEPEQLPTIFDAFYQGEDYLQRSVGGTGLGLSICRRMAEAMHGKLWAESTGPGQGSTFYFQLPLE